MQDNQAQKKEVIMIVEDDAFVMDIYETKLLEEGYEVIEATNGLEGYKKLEEGKIPDLILLDIVMPYMDGMEFLRKIKTTEAFSKIPIILLTNLSQKEDIDLGLGMGAEDYLIKSQFTPSEVFRKIKELLERKRIESQK
ncbi:MAG: response regulator [Patescibacteria group bacterium]